MDLGKFPSEVEAEFTETDLIEFGAAYEAEHAEMEKARRKSGARR